MEPCAGKHGVGGVIGGNNGGALLPTLVGMKKQQRKQQAGYKTKSKEEWVLTRKGRQGDAVALRRGL